MRSTSFRAPSESLPALEPEASTARIDRLVREAQAEGRPPSLVAAVFRGRDMLWEGAVGLADVAAGREATPDTQYPVASITKTFVAVSILRLRDAGELGLDDPLDAHVPEAPSGPTLRGLLAHLSGLQREVAGHGWETLEFPTREEVLASLGTVELVLEPGREWHYSNLAYVLLGEVVARRAGESLERHVEERLLEPLGLGRTTWGPIEPAARGYLTHPFADSVMPEPVVEKGGLGAAGALWSTVRDLARWGAFLVEPDPELLSAASAEEMRSLQAMAETERWTRGWGLGLVLQRFGERVLVGHDGGAIGGRSSLYVDPSTKVGAAVVGNSTAGFDPSALAGRLVEAALEEEPPSEPWRPGPEPPAELASMLGPWWSEGVEFVFSWRSGRLEARAATAQEWRAPAVFEQVGADRFRTVSGRERGEPLELVRDGEGQVVRLYWASYPFTREPRPFGPG